MATKHRIEKINELIRTQISETVSYGLKDPRLENVIVGVSRVNTTPDMKYCKVYFNIYTGDEEQAGEIMGVLEKAAATFILDESYKQYDHINEILKDLDIRQEDEI